MTLGEPVVRRGRGRPRKTVEIVPAKADPKRDASPAGISIPNGDTPLKPPEAAALLLISIRNLNQVQFEGLIPRSPLTIETAVQGYIRYQRERHRQSTRVSTDSAVNVERTRKLKMENDERERRTVPIEDVIAAIDFILGPVKGELAGIGPRITTDPALWRKIDDEIDAKLKAITDRLRKASSSLRTGADPSGADAEDDT